MGFTLKDNLLAYYGKECFVKSPFRHILGGAFGGRELDEQLYGDFTE